jgi:penicillin-binding protein-related factor A (putative recombinase)
MKKNTGKGLERLIEKQCAFYKNRGLLYLEKVDPPTRTFNTKFGKQTTLLSNPFPDFIGCTSNGTMVCIEAKSNQLGSLSFGKNGLRTKQIEDLYTWRRFGAIVGVIWQNPNGYFWVNLECIKKSVSMGRKSIPENITEKIDTGAGNLLNFHKFIL